jgi:hypothetical protein
MLQILVIHAPNYLSREERDDLLVRHLSGYYKFLGESLLLGRDKEFWDYHKGELIKAGIGFSRVRVVNGALITLGNALLNPKDTVERLWHGRHNNRSARHEELAVGPS